MKLLLEPSYQLILNDCGVHLLVGHVSELVDVLADVESGIVVSIGHFLQEIELVFPAVDAEELDVNLVTFVLHLLEQCGGFSLIAV